MAEPNYIKAGKLNKTFGLKGHIRGFLEPALIARLKKLQVVYLSVSGNYLPYFLDETDLHESGHCMFHFEEVTDKTAADQLVGKELFVDEKTLKKAKPYSSLTDYIGFKLIDETLGLLAPLDNLLEFPSHAVGSFIYSGYEVLFPWNEEVVLTIDKRKKEILLRLPDGLMDIYLQGS